MELDEAIIHAKQVADGCGVDGRDCAYQHYKLVDWLEELKRYRERETGLAATQRFAPGSDVVVVERDECEKACDMSGCMFVARVGNYAIVTAYIRGLKTIEETMEYHKEDTAENCHCDLSVFPLEDCYATREAAEAALGKENVEKDGAI